MATDKIHDLQAFLAVAREQSFTKAAVKLGITPSALSHAMKGLEARLGVRLLTRTTRNVAVTEAGERLMHSVGPHFEQIEAELTALGELRDKPAGTIRITCTDDAIVTIFQPMLPGFLQQYPDINVELIVDYGFTNIVELRIDAGVRLGEALSKDMIGVRIGPDWRFAVVGSPGYFERRTAPEVPQDLSNHVAVNLRLTSAGSIYAWEFERDGRKLNVRVEGQLAFNNIMPVLQGAVAGVGLAYVPLDIALPYLADGRLVEVLSDWCPYFQGYHLFYPNRRQASPAFAVLVEALRYRAGGDLSRT
jgi:DNA-binding transcriptional LysR family regulator